MEINKETKDILKNIKERFSSPFYGTFIISWLICNWKIWYLTFFVDSDILFKDLEAIKIDYIIDLYRVDSFWSFLWPFLGKLFVCPLISAWSIVFLMPKLTFYFLKKHEENRKNELEIKFKTDKDILKIKNEKLKKERETLDEEKVLEERRKEIEQVKSKQEVWDREYEKFKKTRYVKDFEAIKECVYEHDGAINIHNKENEAKINSDIKSYFDINGLIELFWKNGYESMKLTEKGKYFLSKYTEEFPWSGAAG